MRWTTRIVPVLALTLTGVGATAVEASAASLRGSRAAMEQQNLVARQHELAFYRTPEEIRGAVARGELVELRGNADYQVADFVRFPYARDALRLFIERLASQYREACGQQLVVTSAVRPTNGQPGNAHALSVHPAGMAVDLRVSDRASCRSWLEDALMNMERAGVLNGIREYHPPHYHVAVFPEPYLAWAAERMAEEPVEELTEPVREQPEVVALVAAPMVAPVEASGPAFARRAAAAATVLLVLGMPLGTRLLRSRRRSDVD